MTSAGQNERTPDNERRSLSPSRARHQARKRANEDEEESAIHPLISGETESETPTSATVVWMPSSRSPLELSRPAELNSRSQDQDGDDDDASSTSSSVSSDQALSSLAHRSDLKFSVTSNLLFLFGAALQISLAAWDLSKRKTQSSMEDDDSSEDVDDHKFQFLDDENDEEEVSDLYQALDSLGPFLFILNAFVDIWWALSATTSSSSGVSNNLCSLSFAQIVHIPLSSTTANGLDQLWDLSIAIFFGIGAFLECYSTLYDVDDIHARGYNTMYYVNMISMHTYLISGLLAVQKDRALMCSFRCGAPARCLVSCGIILFLVGSILDCVISYLYDPELQSDNIISTRTLAACNFSSSLLWFIDAIFYVMADCLIFGILSKVVVRCRAFKLWTGKRVLGRVNDTTESTTRQLSMPLVRRADDPEHDYDA